MKNLIKNIKSKLYKYILNESVLSAILTLIVVITLVILYISQQNIETNVQNNTKNNQNYTINHDFYLEEKTEVLNEIVEPKTVKEVAEEQIKQTKTEQKSNIESEVITDGFYYYSNIPIKEETQRFITKIAEEKGISVELIYAIAKVESNFNANADNGTSVGMFQINQHDTLNWLADQVGIHNVNPYNVKHSVQMSVWYLDYLYNKWGGKGYSEEDKVALTLCSYNRGYGGCKKYIKNHSPYEWFYVNKVLDYKAKLEKERYS